ncbi:MAG: helix-turn-helix transcriptional regulator [Symploca sp. SIO3C6]|uniref:Helix-turn-helix transcriptional regulator n=1 Tax=Symploca sp. SIO1C4 TaxID=2607765 RepID=A0A6B3N767_9CYAN|nr:helix-turn-helix transcriptional regulator [Symploca sp. SIO3C6]NER26472.1 helix-turn-helix transcriptional regulator [Symploca sp. SIO1C4]NET03648.1 helix-turn-helix transcriptional regulator [Symploca sp. SIO2B6]NET53349.1 helix-turn-helix transcriptional regulator [Merismopedia sp. SIO2A8]
MAIKTALVTKQPEIGQLVRELRLSTELTQEKFAAALGVTYPTISRWENGHTKPSPLAIQKIELHLRRMGEQGRYLLQRYLEN